MNHILNWVNTPHCTFTETKKSISRKRSWKSNQALAKSCHLTMQDTGYTACPALIQRSMPVPWILCELDLDDTDAQRHIWIQTAHSIDWLAKTCDRSTQLLNLFRVCINHRPREIKGCGHTTCPTKRREAFYNKTTEDGCTSISASMDLLQVWLTAVRANDLEWHKHIELVRFRIASIFYRISESGVIWKFYRTTSEVVGQESIFQKRRQIPSHTCTRHAIFHHRGRKTTVWQQSLSSNPMCTAMTFCRWNKYTVRPNLAYKIF